MGAPAARRRRRGIHRRERLGEADGLVPVCGSGGNARARRRRLQGRTPPSGRSGSSRSARSAVGGCRRLAGLVPWDSFAACLGIVCRPSLPKGPCALRARRTSAQEKEVVHDGPRRRAAAPARCDLLGQGHGRGFQVLHRRLAVGVLLLSRPRRALPPAPGRGPSASSSAMASSALSTPSASAAASSSRPASSPASPPWRTPPLRPRPREQPALRRARRCREPAGTPACVTKSSSSSEVTRYVGKLLFALRHGVFPFLRDTGDYKGLSSRMPLST